MTMRTDGAYIYQQRLEREENNPVVFFKRLASTAWDRFRGKYQAKGHIFNLTYRDVAIKAYSQNNICALSNVALTRKANDPNKTSIDRIDPNRGYFYENIQLVSARVNVAKGDMTNDEFILMCCRVNDTNRHKVAHLL